MNTAVLASSFVAFMGLLLVALGLQRREPPAPRRRRRSFVPTDRRGRITMLLAGGAGVVAFAFTGWVVMLVVGPAAVLGLPWLLSPPPNRELQMLRALDQWVRLLATSILTGKSIPDAIRATSRQAPDVLAGPVLACVRRLDSRWTIAEALRRLADDLDSPDADAVVIALVLAAERGGTGVAATLKALAASTQDRLRAWREIEAERAKPRIVVRQVSLITLVVLSLALLTGREYFSPFGTPFGQILLAVLLCLYVGALAMLRHRTSPPRRHRILVAS